MKSVVIKVLVTLVIGFVAGILITKLLVEKEIVPQMGQSINEPVKQSDTENGDFQTETSPSIETDAENQLPEEDSDVVIVDEIPGTANPAETESQQPGETNIGSNPDQSGNENSSSPDESDQYELPGI